MKKKLKYIKVNGSIKSKGEYSKTSGVDLYRPYEAVTIVDQEGEELHFNSLIISKRLDDNIKINQPATFYILRYRDGETLHGVVYALDLEGKKLFFPETAIKTLCEMGLQCSIRFTSGSNPFFTGFILVAIGLPVMAGLIKFFSVGFYTSGFIGLASALMFLTWPMINSKKRAGIPEMYKILQADGFDTAGNTSSNY